MRTNEKIAGAMLQAVMTMSATKTVAGDVTALEVARMLADSFTSCPKCGAEPWVNLDCLVCQVMTALPRDER
jgi:hypothetical protein